MANWYLLRDGQPHGPYPEEQVREWVRTGQVGAEEKLNREGDPNWLSVDMIPEFAKERAMPGAVPYVTASPGVAQDTKDPVIAGILGILLGALGIHHFYLGNTTLGIIYLLVTVLSCSFLSPLPAIFGIIEGIIYLTKPRDQFQRNYHNWFCSGP